MKAARHDTLNTFSIITLIALLTSSRTPRESQVDSKKSASAGISMLYRLAITA